MPIKVTTGGAGAGVGTEVGVRPARCRPCPLSPVAVIHGVRHPGPGAGPRTRAVTSATSGERHSPS